MTQTDFTPPPPGGLNLEPGVSFSRERQTKAQFKTQLATFDSAKCATHRWGRVGQWNLAGQKVDLLDVAGRDLDIVFAQELAREEAGWSTSNTELFHWVSHRGTNQYRGVAVGIANDKLDCIIGKGRECSWPMGSGTCQRSGPCGPWGNALPYWGDKCDISGGCPCFRAVLPQKVETVPTYGRI